MKINFVNSLERRFEIYKKRHGKRPFYFTFKLIWWCVCYFFESINKRIFLRMKKDPNKLYIGLAMGGGTGDILISANYVMYLRKYLAPAEVYIDCYTGNMGASKSFFTNTGLINGLFQNYYHNQAEKYDLYYSIIESYPNVMHYDEKKIKRLSPKLWVLIEECLAQEKFMEKTIKHSPKNNSTAYIAAMIQGRNRVQLNDVGNLLGIEPVINFTPNIELDENEVLKKFNLKNVKYVTLNRCVGELNSFWDSNKMWPLEYYNELVEMLKKEYQDYKFIQVGYSPERSPAILNTDDNLVGKTSFEEAKVILKNATLHIDGEGGLVHLRHALKGGQSVVFFGPTSPELYGYPENINIKTNACPHWCDWVIEEWQTKCINNNKKACMKTITPKMAFEKVSMALAKSEIV